jgi:hypothetical protein
MQGGILPEWPHLHGFAENLCAKALPRYYYRKRRDTMMLFDSKTDRSLFAAIAGKNRARAECFIAYDGR